MKLGELNLPIIDIEPFSPSTDIHTRIFFTYESVLREGIGQSVLDALSKDPRVIALNGKLISRGSYSEAFNLQRLAMWFLWSTNQYGKQQTQEALNSFLDSETISVINSLWVLGLKVDMPINLDDGYTVQPIESMPDSNDKEYFIQNRFKHLQFSNTIPVCAITKTCPVGKVGKADPEIGVKENQEYWSAGRRLFDICLILNTLDGVSCLPYYSTSYLPWTMPFGPFTGSGGGGSVYDVLPSGLTTLTGESVPTVNALMAKLDERNEGDRARLQTIFGRLSQAKRRNQIEDKILDLGIALEMLLLNNLGQNEQLSLAFRLRGGWFIGATPEDRVAKCATLNAIYGYRSEVAHTGRLCKGDQNKINNVRESFPIYQGLTEQICQKIVLEGEPDWGKLLLGAI